MKPYVSIGKKSSTLWIRGLRAQARVLHALMMREGIMHHGHDNLGFFWIVAEPLALMAGITLIWSVLHVAHGSDVDVIPFALTGYSFLTLWRHIVNNACRFMKKNAALRYHNQVKLLDVLIAKSLLETLALFTAFVVSYFPLNLLGLCPGLSDPLNVVIGFLLTGIFSFSVGLIISSLSELADVIQNVIGAIMYIILPATGAFAMQEWLPEKVRSILSWSPLVNCIEMIRSGVFPASVPTHWSALYVISCSSIMISIGISLYNFSQRKIEM